ncbi:PREDICTED: diamine acetyltransferase 1-like, partial [Tinamus guttatus]|uniref:diamine acetyltransferase 1-like n=1 Tax=Tinamus guttatus TaxID=94827 RepID=UPI00052ECE8B
SKCLQLFSCLLALILIPDLLQDGFGKHPFYYCLVAEAENKRTERSCTVGYAMYNFNYDPRIGKLLYLKDFYIMEPYRGLGIGSEILKLLSQTALETHCSCMQFLVLICNKPSVEYYIKCGASNLSTEEGWHLFRFNKEALLRMAAE